jgi:hypothetical protein
MDFILKKGCPDLPVSLFLLATAKMTDREE